MVWIGSTVSVSQEIVGAEFIVIRPARDSRDGYWDLHSRWLEDSLRASKSYAPTLELKALSQQTAWQDVPMN